MLLFTDLRAHVTSFDLAKGPHRTAAGHVQGRFCSCHVSRQAMHAVVRVSSAACTLELLGNSYPLSLATEGLPTA